MERVELQGDDLWLVQEIDKHPNCERIDVRFHEGITERSFAHIDRCAHLRILTLKGCRQLSTAILAKLSALSALEELSLESCDQLADDALEFIKTLPLRKLDVKGCSMTPHGLRAVAHFPEIIMPTGETVLFAPADVTQAYPDLSSDGVKLFRLIERNPYCEELSTRTCQRIIDSDLRVLERCPRLRKLSLRGCVKLTEAGLRLIPNSVEDLDLRECKRIDDEALGHLHNQLRRLNVGKCTRVTGSRLGEQFPNLQSLYAEGCWAMTAAEFRLFPARLRELRLSESEIGDDDLAALPEGLRELHLSQCPNLTEDGLKRHVGTLSTVYVKNCPQIVDSWTGTMPANFSKQGQLLVSMLRNNPWKTEVQINGAGQLGDAELACLSLARNLRSLVLQACVLTDQGLQHVAQLSHLRSLTLQRCPHVTGEGLGQFSSDSEIGSLTLEHCEVFSDRGLEAVASQLRQLSSFQAAFCPSISGNGLIRLARLELLQTVSLEAIKGATDKCVSSLLRNPQLRQLRLASSPYFSGSAFGGSGTSRLTTLDVERCPNFMRKGVSLLQHLPELESLSIKGCPGVKSGDLQLMGQLQKLQTLVLSGCEDIEELGLQYLLHCRQLEQLYLWNCKAVTDITLQNVAMLQQLKKLDLRECGEITDEGLEFVAKLEALEELDIGRCKKVTDAGIGHLQRLRLKQLEVKGCDLLTDAGRAMVARILEDPKGEEGE